MSASLTAPLYYYDQHGYKIGPISKKELYALVQNGTIKPETRLTDGKLETQAKNIPKLKFYAPEYHRAEELFNLENVNFDDLTQASNSTQTPQPAQQEKTTMSIPITHEVTNQPIDDLSKLTYHPIIITAIVLLSITALTSTVTCYFVVGTIMAINQFGKELKNNLDEKALFPIIPEFVGPERKFPEGGVEVPQRIFDGFQELHDLFEEKLGVDALVAAMTPITDKTITPTITRPTNLPKFEPPVDRQTAITQQIRDNKEAAREKALAPRKEAIEKIRREREEALNRARGIPVK